MVKDKKKYIMLRISIFDIVHKYFDILYKFTIIIDYYQTTIMSFLVKKWTQEKGTQKWEDFFTLRL